MTAKTFCKLDRNRIGPGLILDANDLSFRTDDTCDIERTILGSVHALSGTFSYECYFWSESRGDLANLISFGVAQPGSSLDKFVGEESTSFGFKLIDGEIWNNNTILATVEAQSERIAVGVILSLSPSDCTCDFMVNGSSVYQAVLPNGEAWLPAFSIGSDTPEDIKCSVNFGQNRFDTLSDVLGWFQQTAGIPTVRIALAQEGFISDRGSTPANTPYKPALLNWKQFSIARSPSAWFQSGSRGAAAAISTLRLNNEGGQYNQLLRADIRDAIVELQIISTMRRGVGSLGDAVTVFTGVLDTVSQPKIGEIEVTLRDSLSRLDRPLPCRLVPPFADASSVGKILPIGLGAQRNVQPLLLDKEDEGGRYALGDAPMSNVTLASDQAAPLDPNSTPPQYRPANGNSEIVLESSPIGRFAVDCSSIGQQWTIPGNDDVLAGDGGFTTFDSSGVPDGWIAPTTPPSVVANGSSAHVSFGAFPNCLQIISRVPYNPQGVGFYFGYWLRRDNVFEPGASYRITFKLVRTLGGNNGDPAFKYGLSLLAGFFNQQRYWISPLQEPLNVPFGQSQTYTFTFQAPSDATSMLPLILAAISFFGGIPPTPISVLATIADLKVERLGQYLIAPLDGITVQDAFTEILVNRAGEDASIVSSADLETVDYDTGYKLGYRYEDVPNILDALQDIVDPVGGAVFTGPDGVIHVRRMADPDTQDPVAIFKKANIVPGSVRQWVDTGSSLTTLAAARPNCTPFGAGDFVTDTITVPADVRAQYQGPAQFLLESTTPTANEYSAARSAARKVLRIDDPEQAQTEINRVNALYAEKATMIYFEATYDDLLLGVGTTCAVHELFYADVIRIDGIPELDFVNTKMAVMATTMFLGDNRIGITARY